MTQSITGRCSTLSATCSKLKWSAALFILFSVTLTSFGQEPAQPLKPLDRSSPRAALTTFLEECDRLGAFLEEEYLDSPSRAGFQRAIAMSDGIINGLNTSEIPLAGRSRTARSAAVELYSVLCRIPLPPFEAIPDGTEEFADDASITRWVIPNTEIVLERSPGRLGEEEFLFSPKTVERASEFYRKVENLPLQRTVPLEDLPAVLTRSGGWMVPYSWVRAMPNWLQEPVLGQPPWKWIGFVVILALAIPFLLGAHRVSRRRGKRAPLVEALARMALPTSVLFLTPIVLYLTRVQLKVVGGFALAIDLVATVVMFATGAWLVWRAAPAISEAFISSPHIAPESVDAHLIRISTRLLSLVLGIGLLAVGADRVGLPATGIIAGLGVGGLAIALAAQSTVENLIGGMSLFADRPIRVGDYCKYGSESGTIEAIGIRSTRIRGSDRTLTTIPNGMLAKMPIVNLTKRDRIQLKCVLGLRYETTPDQLRHVLAQLRDLLLAHPKVTPDACRVQFVGFGDSSLNVEIMTYIATSDWNEFLAVQEHICLQMIDTVEASGSGFALPSQTLYLATDTKRES
jgi:MscS family membrane protein